MGPPRAADILSKDAASLPQFVQRHGKAAVPARGTRIA
jgi:hypothetical protein